MKKRKRKQSPSPTLSTTYYLRTRNHSPPRTAPAALPTHALPAPATYPSLPRAAAAVLRAAAARATSFPRHPANLLPRRGSASHFLPPPPCASWPVLPTAPHAAAPYLSPVCRLTQGPAHHHPYAAVPDRRDSRQRSTTDSCSLALGCLPHDGLQRPALLLPCSRRLSAPGSRRSLPPPGTSPELDARPLPSATSSIKGSLPSSTGICCMCFAVRQAAHLHQRCRGVRQGGMLQFTLCGSKRCGWELHGQLQIVCVLLEIFPHLVFLLHCGFLD